jgi:nicotinamidase/pyrazinamidase
LKSSRHKGDDMKKALILVDVQNDFIPGGALAVPEGDLIVPVANQMMKKFDLVVATQDWHPPDHGSFASRYPGKKPGEFVNLNGLEQILWPDHCVAHTQGAAFVSGLDVDGIAHVVKKGMDKGVDSYSGFFDNDHRKSTGLGEYLRDQEVDQVAIVGLATEYCVKFTALDARRLGFETRLIREGVRGVELNPGDCEKAFTAMRDAGVRIVGV